MAQIITFTAEFYSNLQNFFYIRIIWGGTGFIRKMTSNFHKISTFWDPLNENNGFYKDKLLEGPKRKNEFVNQKYNFHIKIYEIGEKCWETKLFILKRSTILVLLGSYRNVYRKSSAKCEYYDESVFLFIWNKK